MAENSKIEWTTHSWNPYRGCTKVSAGCANCYAETLSGRNPGTLGVWGPNGTRVVASESMWREPLKWDRQARDYPRLCKGCGGRIAADTESQKTYGCFACGGREIVFERPRVFCASLADVFEDWQGPMHNSAGNIVHGDQAKEWGGNVSGPITMQDVRARLFRLIDATPNLDWLLLTKRPENIAKMLPPCKQCETVGRTIPSCTHCYGAGRCLTKRNVWLGTSVENQTAADERIPHLLRVPAAVRFLSCEPLLGPVGLWQIKHPLSRAFPECAADFNCLTLTARGTGEVYGRKGSVGTVETGKIDWVIVGGESGPGARPCRVEWVRSIVEQCKAAGVPCFVKQLGSKPDGRAPSLSGPLGDPTVHDPDHILRIRDKKGGDPSEWPEDLRVREFPTVKAGAE